MKKEDLQSLLKELAKKTKNFPFSGTVGEASSGSQEEIRLSRLEMLVNQVRKMALQKHFQMPDSFRTERTADDWIQEAMIMLYNLCSDYDPERGNFDNYARFIIPRRLTSIQRDIFRKNPPLTEALRKIAVSLKREKGRDPTLEELSDFTGRSISEIRDFMEYGTGKRIFATENEAAHEKKDVKVGMTPEEQYIKLEERRILWDCVDQLDPESKLLFIRHHIEGSSFEKLLENPGIRKIFRSLSTLKRKYRENIFNVLRDCVQRQYK